MEDREPLPKFFKDDSGYCYIATQILRDRGDMQPWDGAVDANGFAQDVVESAQDAKPLKAVVRRKSAQATGLADPVGDGGDE